MRRWPEDELKYGEFELDTVTLKVLKAIKRIVANTRRANGKKQMDKVGSKLSKALQGITAAG